MPNVALELLIVLLLVALNGLLALAEMAVVSSRKARLQQQANTGDAGARAALELAEEPNRLLSTVQVGITLVGILAGAFGGAALAAPLAAPLRELPFVAPYADALAFGAVVVFITVLSLLFGELVPKRLALNNPEAVAAAVARPMQALARLVGPIVSLLGATTDLVLRLIGARTVPRAPVSEEEIGILIAQGREAGVFEQAEQEIVDAVFRLGDRRVGSLMTPRPDVEWLDLEAPPDQVRENVLGSSHSRFPVARGNLDEVVGVVAARDVLAAVPQANLAQLAQRPLFLPDVMPAWTALERFRAERTQIGLVIDEYGGVQGVITLGDILEALVGELPSPEEQPAAVQREDGSWLLDGSLPIEEAVEILELPDSTTWRTGDYRTVGGLVMHHLGRIPVVGDTFQRDDLRFEVVDMDGRRVDKVLVVPPQES